MFELSYELITVAASNPHFIFLFCNLIIFILILVSLEPTSTSDHTHTATPIPPPPPPLPLPPPPAATKNTSFETTSDQTTLIQETSTNVLIDVDQVSHDLDCNLSVKDHEESQDDELRRRVEEFIDKINRGWKAEKMSLAIASFTN